MDRLQLTFLGGFAATIADRPLKITSPKQKALLIWLALNAERSHDRGELTALLWPEHDPQRARQNMRKAISVLRRRIGDYLDISRTAISLTAGCWDSDVAAFEQALQAGDLAAAADRYTGDLMPNLSIDSVEFGEWLLLKREWLRRQWLQLLAQLTADAFERQDYDAAYRYGWRRTEADVYDERAHADVMRALAMLNRRSEALAQFEQLRDLLRIDLEIEPARETQQLYDEIINRSLRPPAVRRDPVRRHNLPRQHTPFVGRGDLLDRLNELLATPSCGLLTLVGMGGSGKTRLAIELGRRQHAAFSDGVWFVPLANVDAGSGDAPIVQAIIQAIDLTVPKQVDDPRAYLLEQLRQWQALLLLDNLEQLLPRVDLILELLAAAPAVKIVVTSREALDLEAEWVVDVYGLPFPAHDWQGSLEQLHAFEAVQLFASSARRRRSDFELTYDAARVARLTHGLPLGLTLAAGWTRTFSTAEVADQIAADVDFLATQRRDADERHRSLRAIFKQTWRLLERAERDAFAGLTVFKGGFTPDAARAVTGASAAMLEGLLDRSLIRRTGDERFIIHPLLLQYAAEQQQGDDTQLHRRHATYYLEMLAVHDHNTPRYQDHPIIIGLRANLENLQAAWSTAVANRNIDLLHPAVGPASAFARAAGLWQLHERWLDALHAAFAPLAGDEGAVDALLSVCHSAQARLHHTRSQFAAGEAAATKALTLAERSGDRNAESVALSALANLTLHQQRYQPADELLQRMLQLARRHGLPAAEAVALNDLAANAIYQAQYRTALDFLQQAVHLAKEQKLEALLHRSVANEAICYIYLGELDRAQAVFDSWIKPPDAELSLEDANDYIVYGNLLLMRGEYERAITFGRQAVAVFRRAKDLQGAAFALLNMSEPLANTGRLWEARQVASEALALVEQIGDRALTGSALIALGFIDTRLGNPEEAQRRLAQGLAIATEVGDHYSETQAANNLAIARLQLKDVAGATAAAERAKEQARAIENQKQHLHALVTLGHVRHAANEEHAAATLLIEAIDGWRNNTDQAYWTEPQALLGLIRLHQGRFDEARRLIDDVLAAIDDRPFFEAEQPELLLYHCYAVLSGLQDERAAKLLQLALAQIDHVSETIPSPHDRRRYRQQLLANRWLLTRTGALG